MYELFRTVLILSLFGFGITAALLIIKPVTAKKFPAKWQYYVWIVVLFSMVLPTYKLIPKQRVETLPLVMQTPALNQPEIIGGTNEAAEIAITGETPVFDREIPVSKTHSVRLFDLLAYVWLAGFLLYLLIIFVSYFVYLAKKRRKSAALTENPVLEDVKNELKIKRRIKARLSQSHASPMLVGVFFPTVYLPSREIADENLRMVFLHELTHYKRGDLLLKWLALFVNAVHWFNPLCYLLVANFSEACEVSCDMEVTKNMSDSQQKTYMKTILDLVEER